MGRRSRGVAMLVSVVCSVAGGVERERPPVSLQRGVAAPRWVRLELTRPDQNPNARFTQRRDAPTEGGVVRERLVDERKHDDPQAEPMRSKLSDLRTGEPAEV